MKLRLKRLVWPLESSYEVRRVSAPPWRSSNAIRSFSCSNGSFSCQFVSRVSSFLQLIFCLVSKFNSNSKSNFKFSIFFTEFRDVFKTGNVAVILQPQELDAQLGFDATVDIGNAARFDRRCRKRLGRFLNGRLRSITN